MTETEMQSYVNAFASAATARDGTAVLAVWHPDGRLHSPFYDRVVLGREMGALADLQRKRLPDLTWTLVDWTRGGDRMGGRAGSASATRA
jgi:hypothetical protein